MKRLLAVLTLLAGCGDSPPYEKWSVCLRSHIEMYPVTIISPQGKVSIGFSYHPVCDQSEVKCWSNTESKYVPMNLCEAP